MNTTKKYIVQLFVMLLPVFVMAQSVKEQGSRYAVKNLKINDAQSNFGASYYKDGKIIYSSPTKKNYILNNIWRPNGQPYLDFYMAEIDPSSGELKKVEKTFKKVNSSYHEGGQVCYDKFRNKVYFTRNNYNKRKQGKINRLQLFVADVTKKGEWINIEKLPFNKGRFSYGHPALSDDGKTLYFVSDMPGGFGYTDIYKVSINEGGMYGTPENLGGKINTSGSEMFPYIDGTDLYFSTDSRNDTYGGLDVYMVRFANDSIYPAINLGNGVNTAQDDFAFVIDSKTRTGYFSSNRPGGKGDDDIYYFKELRPFKFKCTQYYTFSIKDKKTKNLIKDTYVTITKPTGEKVKNGKKTKNGAYSYELRCGKEYIVRASSKHYSEGVTSFYVDNKNEQKVAEIILLEKQFVKKRGKLLIDIKNIYFDYNKFSIRPDAAIELYKVIEIMKTYPELKIEAGSHTDSRGKKSYNKRLSHKRAKSVVDFIISNGISPLRITSKGYGESDPINGCIDGVKCLETQHALNRRTEFVILNPEVLNKN